MLVEKLADVIPTVMFMVGWQRAVLLGPRPGDHLPGLRWTPRETAYLLHLIKVFGITFVLVSALMFTVGSLDPGTIGVGAPLDPELVRRQAMAAPLIVGFIVSMLLALRVCYGLAATAVDVPFSPRLAWAYGRGNAWTIIGSLSSPSWWAPSSPPLRRCSCSLWRGACSAPGSRRGHHLDGGNPGFLWRCRPRGDRSGRHLPPPARLARRRAAARACAVIEGRAASRPKAGRPAAWGNARARPA